MQIEFFDITSFRGISSNAEHFYAKHLDGSYMEEMLWSTDRLEQLRGGTGEDFRYIPARDEAEAMARKDYPASDQTLDGKNRTIFRETAIRDLLEKGTGRFPTIMRIIEEARRRYPDAVLHFTLFGSRKEFIKWCTADKSRFAKAVKLLSPERKKQ